MATDPVRLAAELVRCPSVTPEDGGAMALLEGRLAAAGFVCTRVDRGGVANLVARLGPRGAGRTLGFNGHVDVVPPGPEGGWRHPPFAGTVADGRLWGRGAADMKSGVAAFTAAAIDAAGRGLPADTALILAITGDEEGPARDGTAAILDWMAQEGERMTVCLVGEPTCPDAMGEMIKIGRRGSLTADITATGRQGHSAYPHRALNPLPALVRLLDDLAGWRLDEGSDHFDPSTLAITTIDTGNPANNVIPARATARVNIRFNDHHTGAGLTAALRGRALAVAEATGAALEVDAHLSGEAFLTPPGPLTDLVADAVAAETGRRPALSTAGGTSDARFVRHHCPVVECGLVGATMHQTDEHVATDDIHTLTRVYGRVIAGYCGGWAGAAVT